MDELIQWNKANDRHLLINSLLDETASMSVLTLNLSVMRILEMAVLHCPCKMNNQQWDFILCSLAGWFQVISNFAVVWWFYPLLVFCQYGSLIPQLRFNDELLSVLVTTFGRKRIVRKFKMLMSILKHHILQVSLAIDFIVHRQTCDENRPHLTTSLKCVALCCQACSLFCTVVKFFQKNTSKLHELSVEGQLSDDSHEVESAISGSQAGFTGDVTGCPQNLFDEWEEFFSWTLYSAVLKLFLFHAGKNSLYYSIRFLYSSQYGTSLYGWKGD